MCVCVVVFVFFFQAEDGIRDLVRSRGLGDVYKRQGQGDRGREGGGERGPRPGGGHLALAQQHGQLHRAGDAEQQGDGVHVGLSLIHI